MDISRKQVLRIATAGSVDDGKSTLIGRLLYDTNSITTDRLAAIEERSRRQGLDHTDLSLLTDGLVAEREQGITIDVAHIYFATPKRKYIIADTPGHVEYTRNMVTGASNADVSLILVDARKGLVEQTRRHLYISHLLRVPQVIVCINKMDLVSYDELRFQEIVKDFKDLIDKAGLSELKVVFIPISSLKGENVVRKSASMNWYGGETVLNLLESLEVKIDHINVSARFPIQFVIRPKTDRYHDYRGYTGRIASGNFSVGDQVKVLPSGFESEIAAIHKFESNLDYAEAGDSVSITLKDDIGASRGDMIIKGNDPELLRDITAEVCWMEETTLSLGRTYKLQHGVNEARVKVVSLNYKVNSTSLSNEGNFENLGLNDIGEVELKSSKPIMAESYKKNRSNGAFILIDEFTNNTVGVGFVK